MARRRDKTIRIGGIRVDMVVGFESFQRSMKEVYKTLNDTERSLKEVGNKFTKSLTVPLVAAGAGLLKVSSDFNAATATIRRGTGATGDALKSLESSFKRVAAAQDDSFSDIAKTVTALSAATGQTGTALENTANTILDLAEVTGSDLNAALDGSIKLFRAFNVSAETQTSTLDTINKVTQLTNISLGELLDILGSGAPLFKTFNLSLEDSAALIGSIKKAGLDVEPVLAGLAKAAPALAKAGIPFAEGFQGIIEKLRTAKTETEALNFAAEIFGSKAALKIVQAARSGALSFDEMKKSIQGSGETIANLAEQTKPLTNILGEIRNSVYTALEPFARILGGAVKTALESIKPSIESFAKAIAGLSPETQKWILILGGGLAVIGPLIHGIGLLVTAIKSIALAFAVVVPFLLGPAAPFTVFFIGVTAGVYQLNKIFPDFFSNFLRGLKVVDEAITVFLDRINSVTKAVQFLSNISTPFGAAKELTGIVNQSTGREGADIFSETKAAEYEKRIEALKGISSGQNEVKTSAGQAAPVVTNLNDVLNQLNNSFGSGKDKAKEAADAIKSLKESLADAQNEAERNSLEKALQLSLDKLDRGAFDSISQKLAENTEKGIREGYAEAVAKGGEEAKKIVDQIVDVRKQEETQYLEGQYTDQMKAAHEQAVQSWQGFFENAITGVKFDLEDMFEQIAVGFAAQLAASLFGNLGGLLQGVSSPQGLGSSLAQAVLGSFTGSGGGLGDILGLSGAGGGLGSLFGGMEGIGPLADAQAYGLSLNTGMSATAASLASTAASIASVAGITYGATSLLSNLTDNTKDWKGGAMSGAALGAGIGTLIAPGVGTLIGALAGGAGGGLLGGLFGSSKPTNPETLAREALENKLEELIQAIDGMKFIDSAGNLRTVNNIELGQPDRFNRLGWAQEDAQTFGEEATNAFFGVGEALEEMFGIAEDIGSQFGSVLLNQFGGDIEGLKAIIDTVGLSWDKFVEMMITKGKQGEGTWLEIISQMRDAREAFEKGLTGDGQFNKAFQNLLSTAGRGQIALNQVQNLAIEGLEAGLQTVDQLTAALQASGNFSDTEIQALMKTFKDLNIQNLEELTKATDLQLAEMVATLDANLQDMGGSWREASEDITKFADTVNALDKRVIEFRFSIGTSFDEGTKAAMESGLFDAANTNIDVSGTSNVTQKFATGGILTKPTMVAPGALAGEAGPEAILPLTRVNGKLGVLSSGAAAQSMVVNIDARGAERGVENDIMSALAGLEDRVVRRAVGAVYDQMRRGAL